MILLENQNLIVQNILNKKMAISEGAKPENVDSTLTDDDGTFYHIHNVDKERTKIAVEVNCKFWSDLKKLNIKETMEQKFSNYSVMQPTKGLFESLFFKKIKDNKIAFVIELDKFCDQICIFIKY